MFPCLASPFLNRKQKQNPKTKKRKLFLWGALMNAICKLFKLVLPVMEASEANMCSLWGVCNETWPHLWSIPVSEFLPLCRVRNRPGWQKPSLSKQPSVLCICDFGLRVWVNTHARARAHTPPTPHPPHLIHRTLLRLALSDLQLSHFC